MNKAEFLSVLRDKLKKYMTSEDVEATLEYYSEMADDICEGEGSEEQAIEKLGSPEQAAKQILSDFPIKKLVKNRFFGKSISKTNIVLLIVGSPMWISIIAVFIAIVAAYYSLLLALAVIFFSVGIALAAVIIAGLIYGIIGFIRTNPATAGFFIGCGIAAAGLFILVIPAIKPFIRLMIKLFCLMPKCIRAILIGKGEKI